MAACLGRGALLAFVNVGSFCISVAFVGVALSLLRLRKIAPDLERPYRLPAGKLVAGCAAVGSLLVVLAMVIPASPAVLKPIEWAILAVLCLCGIVFWITGRGQRDTITEDDRAGLILNDQSPTIESNTTTHRNSE
jgi:amino acid transporter